MADEKLKDDALGAVDNGKAGDVEVDAAAEGMDAAKDGAAKNGSVMESENHEAAEETSTDGDFADDDDLDLPMDEINALLSATNEDRKNMNAQMRRVAQREAESRRRVEETVKSTKTSPRWYVPLFCAFLIIGMLWAVVYYLTSSMPGGGYPIPALKQWNLLVALIIVLIGFIMTVAWY